jgi:hypothetical protein
VKASRGLERLYATSPREFTRARNALAKELREAGDAEGARTVARLKRPGAVLWAVNQLARTARAPLERFLDAVERLRRTQLSDPRGAMEAMRKQREQLDALVKNAGAALRDAGFRQSADTTRRISAMLLGAAADERYAGELRAGRLTEEPPAPGFEALAGVPRSGHLRVLTGGAATRGAKPERAAERERTRTAARAERQRERERAAQERQRTEAEQKRQAEQLQREAEQRAAEVARLEREATAARERLAELDRRLSEARRLTRATRRRGGGGRRPASPP